MGGASLAGYRFLPSGHDARDKPEYGKKAMSGIPGRSGRKPLPNNLAVLRGTRRPVRAGTPTPSAKAHLGDLRTAYAFTKAQLQALTADADDMATGAYQRAIYQSFLREIRGQMDLLLRLGAAVERAEREQLEETQPATRSSKWGDLLS